MDEHKIHDTVSAAEQRTEKQKQLKEMQKMFQRKNQQREKDLQQLREAVESHKCSAQTAVEDIERIFTELIRFIERSRSELIRLIRDQEKAAVNQSEGRLERLGLKDKLQDFCQEELKKNSDRVTSTKIRNDFLQYSHRLTPDLNTVSVCVCLRTAE
ncbi:hypothetical protein QQF64_023632 [Cirrhinus molitorella]|uniref:TRIM8/14/16/25/29/45/65 coiled-coil region domain-containing protein n=1 Tax=Cirrhinus molitorella TaxID=172907 RepID=A0ABR3NJ17_9TELE